MKNYCIKKIIKSAIINKAYLPIIYLNNGDSIHITFDNYKSRNLFPCLEINFHGKDPSYFLKEVRKFKIYKEEYMHFNNMTNAAATDIIHDFFYYREVSIKFIKHIIKAAGGISDKTYFMLGY